MGNRSSAPSSGSSLTRATAAPETVDPVPGPSRDFFPDHRSRSPRRATTHIVLNPDSELID